MSGKEVTKYDISKSVRFDSRSLATVGRYLVRECGYPITTSTDLIRSTVEKFKAFIVASGQPEITSYRESREWFIDNGLGDLFNQGNKQNKAHIRVSAKENELFTSFSRVMGSEPSVPAELDEYEASMLDALQGDDGAEVTVEREITAVEPEDRKKDVAGLANLNLEEMIKGAKDG